MKNNIKKDKTKERQTQQQQKKQQSKIEIYVKTIERAKAIESFFSFFFDWGGISVWSYFVDNGGRAITDTYEKVCVLQLLILILLSFSKCSDNLTTF